MKQTQYAIQIKKFDVIGIGNVKYVVIDIGDMVIEDTKFCKMKLYSLIDDQVYYFIVPLYSTYIVYDKEELL